VKAAQVLAYHVVVQGKLIASVDSVPPLEVNAGEIILFPQNDSHTLSSGSNLKPVRARDLVRRAPDGMIGRIDHGGGGEVTRIVCGFLGTEDAFDPLLSTLPRMLKLDVRKGTSRDWIEASSQFAASELANGRLASSNVLSRLSEVLLVEAVREYASLAETEPGWLKGIRDPHVGRALAIIHQEINAPLTAELLAKRVALSRSAFMERFNALIGMPPIRYLSLRRLNTAKLMLDETTKSVAQIAHEVGYDSEVAFSRAYKREFGFSPSHWRGRRREA
jgi:AraC-like DNA-binding protein